jgi:hypothetical protein
MTDAELGTTLRNAGLTPRALAAAWGTSIAAHLPRVMPDRPLPATAATAALRLLVAGLPVDPIDAGRGLGRGLEALRDRGLVRDDDDGVRARCAIVPIGPSLIVTDPAAWPDDSSHHLIGCLPPARAARWLDVGTGTATAPLARPETAAAIVAADIDPRAIDCARRGVALSDVRHVAVVLADLTADTGVDFDLVTFNLPIPAEAGLTSGDAPGFRHAARGADLAARFLAEVRARIAVDATIVLHAWLGPSIETLFDALPGEVVVVRYTPDAAAPFGIIRWRPGATRTRRRGHRIPTPATPHLSWDDLESAPTA